MHVLKPLYTFRDKNIWWDEGLAIWAVRQHWLEITLWTAGDVHPLLYSWPLWFWTRIKEETELLARYLTVMMATLTVAAIFLLIRRVGRVRAGLLELSRFHIWWSRRMRMYIPAALFFALPASFLLKAISCVNSGKFWVRWIISGPKEPRAVPGTFLLLRANVPLKDRYELINAPSWGYILEVGVYLQETGERLPLSGERANPEFRRIVIGTIRAED